MSIPQCNQCQDNGNINQFEGFYQECSGYRRIIRTDGTKEEYKKHHEASYKKRIRCISCGFELPEEKILLWTKNYEWDWPQLKESAFDASQLSDTLFTFFKAQGSEPVRLSIEKSNIRYEDFPSRIDKRIATIVKEKTNIQRLYSFQAEALDSLFSSPNRVTVVHAPTNAGKSLIYQLFLFQQLLENPRASMIALFPMQALVKDQARSLLKFANMTKKGIPTALTPTDIDFEFLPQSRPYLSLFYGTDSDSKGVSPTRRTLLKMDETNILLGTPDKIYCHLHKKELNKFLKNLSLIVIDEAHTATGIFGGNYAYLIRRILALAPGAKLLIMSATFNKAEEFAVTLCGESKINIIDGSNTIVHKKEVLLVPLWTKKKKSRETEQVEPSTAVLDTLCQIAGIYKDEEVFPSGLIFGYSKRSLALLFNLIEKRGKSGELPAQLKDITRIFKRDLVAETKDELLLEMHKREVALMLSTNALELGIDVGNIDFVILENLPDSELALVQRIGRAGRSRDGLALVFVDETPYGKYWLEKTKKSKKIDITDLRVPPVAVRNHHVIKNNYCRFAVEAKIHLNITTLEQVKDIMNKWSGTNIDTVFTLIDDKKFAADFTFLEKYLKENPNTPMRVALNMGDVDIIFKDTKKGKVSIDFFFRDLHLDAVWTDHVGKRFKVVKYECKTLENNVRFPEKALVEEEYKDRQTYGWVYPDIAEQDIHTCAENADGSIKYGLLKIKEKSPGYWETIDGKTSNHLYNEDNEMCAIRRPVYETPGLLFQNSRWEKEDKCTLNSFLYVFINIGCHYIGASEEDVRPSVSEGKIVITDRTAGGNGVSYQLLNDISLIIKKVKELINRCTCDDGCYSCIWPRYIDKDSRSLIHKENVLHVIDMVEEMIKDVHIPADFSKTHK